MIAPHTVGREYLRDTIGRTGFAFLTLLNEYDEQVIVGNVDKMRSTKKALKLSWKLPAVSHISPFTRAIVSTDRQILWDEGIQPVRLDDGTSKFQLEW